MSAEAPPLHFRILGPLEVRAGERPLAVGGAKRQALLALLVLDANEVVSRDRIVDELWGEDPPPTVATALHVHVSELRKSLDAGSGATLATRGNGYALDVDRQRVDAVRFEHLLAAGREARERGDVETAARTLADALALWRGPALAGIDLPSARTAARRLDDLRLVALEERFAADLALGRHAEVASDLEAAVRREPLRERLRELQMLALYRSGRQSDALDVYRDYRRTLSDELGLEPSPSLRELEQAILRQDDELAPPALPSQPAHAPARRRPVRSLVLAVAFVLVTVAAAAFVLAARDAGEASLRLPPNAVGRIDVGTNRLVDVVPVGEEPRALAAGLGAIWAANYRSRTVTRIDSRTRQTQTIGVDGHPVALAVAGGALWIATVEGTVLRLHPEYGSTSAVSIGGLPRAVEVGAMVAGGGRLWLTANKTTLVILDPRAPDRARLVVPRLGARGLVAFGEGVLWVDAPTGVFAFRPSLGVEGDLVGIAGRPRALAYGASRLWIAVARQTGRDAVVRVAPQLEVVETSIDVGDNPSALVFAGGSLWCATRNDRTVARIDPKTNRVTARVSLGAAPVALAADRSGVWVAAA